MSGFHQQAFSHVRDIIETASLIDYFSLFPDKISAWRIASEKDRRRDFSPAAVRKQLDLRDGKAPGDRAIQYGILCKIAVHPDPSGFSLNMEGNVADLGPTFSAMRLEAWIEEILLRCGPASIIAVRQVPNLTDEEGYKYIVFADRYVEYCRKAGYVEE